MLVDAGQGLHHGVAGVRSDHGRHPCGDDRQGSKTFSIGDGSLDTFAREGAVQAMEKNLVQVGGVLAGRRVLGMVVLALPRGTVPGIVKSG